MPLPGTHGTAESNHFSVEDFPAQTAEKLPRGSACSNRKHERYRNKEHELIKLQFSCLLSCVAQPPCWKGAFRRALRGTCRGCHSLQFNPSIFLLIYYQLFSFLTSVPLPSARYQNVTSSILMSETKQSWFLLSQHRPSSPRTTSVVALQSFCSVPEHHVYTRDLIEKKTPPTLESLIWA